MAAVYRAAWLSITHHQPSVITNKSSRFSSQTSRIFCSPENEQHRISTINIWKYIFVWIIFWSNLCSLSQVTDGCISKQCPGLRPCTLVMTSRNVFWPAQTCFVRFAEHWPGFGMTKFSLGLQHSTSSLEAFPMVTFSHYPPYLLPKGQVLRGRAETAQRVVPSAAAETGSFPGVWTATELYGCNTEIKQRLTHLS